MKANKILWIIIFNLVIIVSEILFGVLSNSFALIADALHNVGDVIAVAITYLALRLSTVRASFKYTFGFMRAEMMAGFVNTLFLFLTMFYMMYEAVVRFLNPEPIEPIYMILVGTIAVIANGISAYILSGLGVASCAHGEGEHHHHHEKDTNIESAYLHMLSDALISVGVVVAGIFIYFFKIYSIDSVLTIVFSIYILFHSYPLLKKSFLSLMDVNTSTIDKEHLDSIIKNDSHVVEYHNLRIYKPSSKDIFISFYIVVANTNLELHELEAIKDKIKEQLTHFGFNHVLIEVESEIKENHVSM